MEPHFGFSFRNRDDLNKIGSNSSGTAYISGSEGE